MSSLKGKIVFTVCVLLALFIIYGVYTNFRDSAEKNIVVYQEFPMPD